MEIREVPAPTSPYLNLYAYCYGRFKYDVTTTWRRVGGS